MRERVIGAAKTAAGVAAGLGAVIIFTAVLIGIAVTGQEVDDGIDRD